MAYIRESIPEYYIGLSTDAKPSDAPIGSKAYELNTKRTYKCYSNTDGVSALWALLPAENAGPVRGVEFTVYITLTDKSTYDVLTNPIIVAGDVTVSKDDGAKINITTLPTVVPAGGEWVKVVVSAAEMDADCTKILFKDQDNVWFALPLVLQTT